MRIKYLMILAILLTSCFKNLKVTDSLTTGQSITEIVNDSSMTYAINDSVIIENKVMHSFSQMDNKDEFYICIKGESIIEGKMIFKITKSDGTELLNEEFPSYLLIDYGFEGDVNSVKDREDYLKRRIKDFFNDRNFLYPAIKTDENFDEDYSNKDIWDEIKSDDTIVGFSYLIGEEDSRKIAFSKKKKKVVMYFNCC
jgi:hypothetical protein